MCVYDFELHICSQMYQKTSQIYIDIALFIFLFIFVYISGSLDPPILIIDPPILIIDQLNYS